MKSLLDFIRKHKFYITILLITLVGCLAWQMSTWLFSDDYVYMRPVTEEGQDTGFWQATSNIPYSVSVALSSSWCHWLYVNGRLANILYIWMQLIPMPLVKFLNGLMMAFMFVLYSRFFVDWRHMLRRHWMVILVLLCFWTMPTWHDTMQSSVYQINYTWSTCLVLLAILSIHRLAKAKVSPFLLTLMCIEAFVAGWMHEGLTSVLIAYITIRLIVSPEFRNRRCSAIFICVLIGYAMSLTASTFGRVEHSGFMKYHLLQYVATRYLRQIWPVYIASATMIWAWLRLRCDRMALKKYLIDITPYFVAQMAGLGVALVLIYLDRGLWGAYIFSALITLRSVSTVAAHNKPSYCILCHRAGTIAAWVFVTLYALWLANLVKWQIIFTAEEKAVASSIQQSGSSSFVYLDCHDNSEVPFWLGDMVAHIFPVHEIGNYMESRSMSDCRKSFTSVLPDKLRDVPYEDLPSVPGNNPFRGVFPEILCDTLYKDAHVFITVSEPMPNFSPIQGLLATLSQGNPYAQGATATYRVKLEIMPVRDKSGRLLVKYLPYEVPVTIKDRRFVRLDFDDGTVIPEFDDDTLGSFINKQLGIEL